MPPAFVAQKNAVVKTSEWGKTGFDLGFGGVFYARAL
jgi:proline racemase